ncbi:MAG TPA: hypothetical protein VFP39_08300 [Gemmatimonadales bacterium]|nr:hypothetical protein [Gemmatimonadales bacterium]
MPTSAIAVRCADPTVRAMLEQWLAGLRIAAPPGLALDVALVPEIEVQNGARLFEQPEVGFLRGPDGRGLRIVWEEAPAVADLPGGTQTATVRLSPIAAAQLEQSLGNFFMAIVILLLRRAGWYHLHAATAIDPTSRGWLFAGNAHCGKSTTAALLAASGWQVGTDDAAFLESRDARVIVHTCRAPIALRPGGRALLARAGGIELPQRGKVGYWPEDLGGVWTPLVFPEIVIFTSVGDAQTTGERIAAAVALGELVRWSAWVMLEPDLAQDHLNALTRLTVQARCYRVTLGRDLFARPNRLTELVT